MVHTGFPAFTNYTNRSDRACFFIQAVLLATIAAGTILPPVLVARTSSVVTRQFGQAVQCRPTGIERNRLQNLAGIDTMNDCESVLDSSFRCIHSSVSR